MARIPLVLDSNLLLLLTVGLVGVEHIARHKRLRAYDAKDFLILSERVRQFSGLILCPNVATDTSNLIRHADRPLSSRYGEMLRALFASSEEQFVATVHAAGRAEYARLGVTDAVLLRMAETGAYLLTADLELYIAALAGGLPAENFAHLQALRADYQ